MIRQILTFTIATLVFADLGPHPQVVASSTFLGHAQLPRTSILSLNFLSKYDWMQMQWAMVKRAGARAATLFSKHASRRENDATAEVVGTREETPRLLASKDKKSHKRKGTGSKGKGGNGKGGKNKGKNKRGHKGGKKKGRKNKGGKNKRSKGKGGKDKGSISDTCKTYLDWGKMAAKSVCSDFCEKQFTDAVDACMQCATKVAKELYAEDCPEGLTDDCFNTLKGDKKVGKSRADPMAAHETCMQS